MAERWQNAGVLFKDPMPRPPERLGRRMALFRNRSVLVWGGTQAADGRWAHLRKALPKGLHLRRQAERTRFWKFAGYGNGKRGIRSAIIG